MKITFHGAAHTVTGSKHLLSLEDGTKILLDCGMFQGLGTKTHQLNEEFGFNPASVSCLLLSHAHIDHSGLIPRLVKYGFKGKIYCTAATRELTEILLTDSAEIQVYETEILNRTRSKHNLEPFEPLYSYADVKECLSLFETINYDASFHTNKNVEVLFSNAGHLIGSASIHLTINEKGEQTTIAYSGDVGRYRSTLLKSASPFPQADHIIIESTYGDSNHQPNFNTIDPLLKWITKTCIEKKGKLIIPAFSVGRTQEVLYALNQLELEKRLPELHYFVDSPLSQKATGIIKHYMEEFNERLQQVLLTDDDPFDFKGLKYVESAEDSKRLSEYNEPCVIISASGTADAGRVKHHIYSSIHNENNTILFVGYCQQQSLGGQLLQGSETVEIYGDECVVKAEINAMNSMSAHGDCDDLIQFLSCQDAEKVKSIFLVHGEHAIQKAFAARLERKGFQNIIIPSLSQEFDLSKMKKIEVETMLDK